MKIALSASGRDLDSPIDPRFGRCAYFIVVDPDDMSFEVFDNENIALGGGAGIQSAQFVASKGASVVITGNVGPNAVRTLSAAGLEVITGHTGTVRQAVEDYKSGKLKSTTEPNVRDHYGMGSGFRPGGGMGRGGGMGMGRGGGMGMGRGRGMGGGMSGSRWAAPSDPNTTSLSKEEELKLLKDQAKELRNQIEAIESRIKETEKK